MLKNIANLTLFDFKVNKKAVIGWCISIFSIMFLYMILFPSVQDMAQIKLEAMPQELLDLVGMSNFSDMGNFITYFAMIYNLILIAISIFTVTFSANLLAKEEKNKTIEFTYSLKISRLEIYFSKFFTAYISLMAVLVSAVVSAFICGVAVGGDTFLISDFIAIVKGTSFTPFVFMALGLMLSGTNGKISGSMIGSISVLISYLFGFLSTLVSENLTWIKYLSPFESFNMESALDFSTKTVALLGIYFSVMIISIVVGAVIYKRRDLKV